MNKKLLTLTISSLITTSLLNNAIAQVKIESIIPTGVATKTSTEAAPNIWFTLDDSGSMGPIYPGSEERYYLGYGDFIPYNSDQVYELPTRPDGTNMPIPSIDRFYLNPFYDAISNVESFESIAMINNLGRANLWTRLWNFTTPADDAFYGTPQLTCRVIESDPNKRENCIIWRNYYSTRLRALQSSLILSLLSEKLKDKTSLLRVGYQTLNSNTQYEDDDPFEPEHLLPLLPLSGPDADQNWQTLSKWIYGLEAYGGTPARRRYLNNIKIVLQNSNPNNKSYEEEKNPFLKLPGQALSTPGNEINACRRNFSVLLTDGEWNYTSDYKIEKFFKEFDVANYTTEDSFALPDGNQYTPRAPYKKVKYIAPGSTKAKQTTRTLADLAFAAWATDIDGDTSNNSLSAKNTILEGKEEGESLHGSPYWHPYNDHANWQHINTFTIGFGLLKNKEMPIVNVNPPKGDKPGITPAIVADNFNWSIHLEDYGYYNDDDQWVPLSPKIYTTDTTLDLANAAVASRGRYYNAESGQDLISAFDDIINEATTPSNSVLNGVKGSGGIAGTNFGGLDGHYSTRYDFNTFTGDLTKFELFSGKEEDKNKCFKKIDPNENYYFGKLCDKPLWKLTDKINKIKPKNRIILSAKRRNKSNDLDYNEDLTKLNKDDLSYKQTVFKLNKNKGLSKRQRKTLIKHFTPPLKDNFDTNATRLGQLVQYVRGNTAQDGKKFRERTYTNVDTGAIEKNVMGSIMRSSPVFSGVPDAGELHPGTTTDAYRKFVSRYVYVKQPDGSYKNDSPDKIKHDFVNVLYVGANDGMLHAIKATGTGTPENNGGDEIFSYIPNAVYKNLPKLVETGIKQSFVDGGIDIQPVDLSTDDWQQVLVSTMGGGAKGLFALNVTNPETTTDIAMWEYTELESILHQKEVNASVPFENLQSNIGNIIAKPGIVQLNDGTWAAVVGNGYNAESNKAALIVINLKTGKAIQELVLDNKYVDNNKTNGLGPVYFLSYPESKNNRVDRAYAGDLQGNMWVFDLTEANANGGIKVVSDTAEQKPLFVAQYKEGSEMIKQPITVAPLVTSHPTGYGFLVHFGTGSLFTVDDLSSTIKNSIYAIWDDWVPNTSLLNGLPKPRTGELIENDQLRKVEFNSLSGENVTTKDGKPATARILKQGEGVNEAVKWAVEGSDYTNQQRGWYVDLEVGERAWQPAFIKYGVNNVESVAFNTANFSGKKGSAFYQEDVCTLSGNDFIGWQMVFNIDDATQAIDIPGTFDLNNDGNINDDDTIDAEDPDALIVVSGGLKSELIFNPSDNNIGKALDDTKLQNPEDSKFCNYKNQTEEGSGGSISSTQVCRKSHTGSWFELK